MTLKKKTTPLKHAPKKQKRVKKRNKDATQKALIHAATQLFASKGYDATRTLEIAQKAKVNEALITRYFGGKSGLLVEVMKDDASQEAIINQGSQCPASAWIPTFENAKNIREFLGEFFKCGAQHLEDKQEFIRIGLSQALIDPKMGEVLKNKTLDQSVPILLKGLKSKMKKKISHDQLEAAAFLILSSNFAINFLGKFIHQIDQVKIDRITDLLTTSLSAQLE